MIARILLPSLLLAAPLSAQITTPAADILFMKDAAGTRRAGHIVGVDANTFRVEILLAGGSGAKATIVVPRAQVSHVEFAPSDARAKLIASPISANAAALGGEWRRWQPLLAVAKSPAGALGNAYAAALLSTGDPDSASRALELFQAIEKEGWSEADKSAARQGRLRAMVATGHGAEVIEEVTKLAQESEDPTILIEVKFILAEVTREKLRKLVEDNPRWTEDLLVRPEHDRLYNEALDLYLHPYLFLGSETEAASRGLWGAVQMYRFVGDDRNAIESSRDLVALYAGTQQAALARDYLDKLPDNLKNQDAEKDAGTEQ